MHELSCKFIFTLPQQRAEYSPHYMVKRSSNLEIWRFNKTFSVYHIDHKMLNCTNSKCYFVELIRSLHMGCTLCLVNVKPHRKFS